MKPQEMLKEIKTLLGVEHKISLTQMKLENGTVIEAESFETEYEVFIVTEDEKIALPVGEYALEDGRILVVQEEGIIAEIKEVSGEEEPEAEAPEAEVEMEYVSKEEFTAAIEEIKMMIQNLGKEEPKEEPKEELSATIELSTDVPANASTDVPTEVIEAVKEDLSEAAAKPIKHNPEAQNLQKQMNTWGQKREASTRDRVFARMANFKS